MGAKIGRKLAVAETLRVRLAGSETNGQLLLPETLRVTGHKAPTGPWT
jgi:hypothetical protein